MFKACAKCLRSARRSFAGITNKADDVFAFFTSPPGQDNAGLHERPVWLSPPSSSSSSTADEDDDTVTYGTHTVARIASNAQIATAIAAVYDPVVYAYSTFDYFTIEAAMEARVVVLTTPSDTVRQDRPRRRRRCPTLPFLSPYALIRHPRSALRSIGPAYEAALSETLRTLLAERDAHGRRSLVQCVCHVLGVEAATDASMITTTENDGAASDAADSALDAIPPSTNMVSFLRGLLLCSATDDPLTAQASFVLDALLQDGVIDDTHLSLPGDYQDRAVALTDLMIEGSLEFGSESMLNAALLLMRQSGQESSFRRLKDVCLVQCFAERRAMDWAYKSTLPTTARRRKRPSKGATAAPEGRRGGTGDETAS